MRLWTKIGLGAVGLLVVAAAATAGYVSIRWDRKFDDIEGPDLKFAEWVHVNVAAVPDPSHRYVGSD